jgi:hypothetical protein
MRTVFTEEVEIARSIECLGTSHTSTNPTAPGKKFDRDNRANCCLPQHCL